MPLNSSNDHCRSMSARQAVHRLYPLGFSVDAVQSLEPFISILLLTNFRYGLSLLNGLKRGSRMSIDPSNSPTAFRRVSHKAACSAGWPDSLHRRMSMTPIPPCACFSPVINRRPVETTTTITRTAGSVSPDRFDRRRGDLTGAMSCWPSQNPCL
jgi:hypothetical protein